MVLKAKRCDWALCVAVKEEIRMAKKQANGEVVEESLFSSF